MTHVFDRPLIEARRRRAARLGPATFLVDHVAAELADRLAAAMRTFRVGIDLGTPTDGLKEALADRVPLFAVASSETRPDRAIVCDLEALPFGPASLDLVVSALALDTVNDLPGTLVQVRRALKPDGLFMAAMLGGDTLHELRTAFAIAESETRGGASPRVAPFADVRDAGALLQRAGFALPVTDQDRLTVRYDNALALMADLRRMGATNALVARSRVPLTRETLARACAVYAERFSDPDGRVRATFQVIWLAGWAPHESQQKPLRPGTAAARLADALGTVERPAGEKAGG